MGVQLATAVEHPWGGGLSQSIEECVDGVLLVCDANRIVDLLQDFVKIRTFCGCKPMKSYDINVL